MSVSKKALITGITGQDGSYLAELLLNKGYEVHGIIRRSSTFNTSRLENVFVDPHEPSPRFILHYGDLADSETIADLIYNLKLDEVYHLGAQSHVIINHGGFRAVDDDFDVRYFYRGGRSIL